MQVDRARGDRWAGARSAPKPDEVALRLHLPAPDEGGGGLSACQWPHQGLMAMVLLTNYYSSLGFRWLIIRHLLVTTFVNLNIG